MKEFEYMCDMGSLKIMFTDDKKRPMGSAFFMNNYGDGVFKVFVDNKENMKLSDGEFKGHFTIIKHGYLMASDCTNEDILYKFPKGRYFVTLRNDVDFYIYKCDEDLHA